MIDPRLFRASREAGRAHLAPEVARDSFSYYIDIPNTWESYRSPEDLLVYFGIHHTHKHQFTEIVEDLGALDDAERDWALRYVAFFDRLARLFTTTGHRTELQYDIAETLFDWRKILSFVELPARILDYGAGCGRHCVSAFLRHPGNVYTAVDSTMAAYTVQNMVFSFLDTLGDRAATADLLDYETAQRPFPAIAQAGPGNRFHLPAWLAAEHLPPRAFDLALACHVHNELSRSDFLRLMAAVERGLADDGVFYVRSELGVLFPKDYYDAVDLHAVDMVTHLAERAIVPVFCAYEAAFQTTVFAREGSRAHQRARTSGAPEAQVWNLRRSWEMSAAAAAKFSRVSMQRIAASGRRTLLCGAGDQFFDELVGPAGQAITLKQVHTEREMLPPGAALADAIARFDPEIVVLASQQFAAMEATVRAALPGRPFALRRQYFLPVVFLYREPLNRVDPVFAGPIRTVGDIESLLGRRAPVVLPQGLPAQRPRLEPIGAAA